MVMLLRLIIILGVFITIVPAQQPNAALLQRYSEEGERALAAKRYSDAATAYEKLRELSPGTAEIHARLGLIYFQQGNFTQAVSTLQQAMKLKPALPNIDLLLAMSLNELGRFEEALPGLQKGFRRVTDSSLKRASGLQLQRAYTGLKQDSKAVEVALELTRLYPDDPEILYQASRLFSNLAYLTTVKLSQVAPETIWMNLTRGELDESQGQHNQAIREYREALSINPNKAGIHFRLGRVFLARQQAQPDSDSEMEALKEFEQELLLDPTNANAAYEAGELHRKAARFDKAQELFSIALRHYPDFEDALIGQGRTLSSQGKHQDALPFLNKAVKLNARNEVAHYQLAQIYRALGNQLEMQRALAEYQRLQTQKSARSGNVAPQREVTKQTIDPKPQP
jgi:tetratricopeptide (TPR) repeat protein